MRWIPTIRPDKPATVAQGQVNTSLDFGFIGAGAIGDRVWLDENGDGVQDAGEAGIPNLTVTLTGTDANGNPVALTTVTDADGGYVFSGLLPSNAGGYTITVTPPAGLNPTYDENGIGTGQHDERRAGRGRRASDRRLRLQLGAAGGQQRRPARPPRAPSATGCGWMRTGTACRIRASPAWAA